MTVMTVIDEILANFARALATEFSKVTLTVAVEGSVGDEKPDDGKPDLTGLGLVLVKELTRYYYIPDSEKNKPRPLLEKRLDLDPIIGLYFLVHQVPMEVDSGQGFKKGLVIKYNQHDFGTEQEGLILPEGACDKIGWTT